MAQIFEYFVVCGLGPEIRTLDGNKGYHGVGALYLPSLLDQYPPDTHSLYPPPPPQLPTCVLPAGVEIFSTGFDANDPSSLPRSYPIVLTEGDGSKIYVSCIAFRDPVSEDIAEAYRIPPNSFADKCICLISRYPSFGVLRTALEELFALCFSSGGSSKPLWDVIAHMVSKVPLPIPGKDRVLFAIENCLLSVDAPPKNGLPHVDISFQPLVQCLDVDNLILLFTAVLLERRILLRSDKYSLLTIVSEGICHLIYPFRWQHVYIPLLFFSGVDYIDAPTPYMMGLHSSVDTSYLSMDGVVIVDLEYNRISTTEEIPPIPEPEFTSLRMDILKLLHPNVVGIDQIKSSPVGSSEQWPVSSNQPWGEELDLQLRLIFLRFFASILGGYRNFIENSAAQAFNNQAFLKKRSRSTHQPPDAMISQFLDTHGFLDFLEKTGSPEESDHNLLDKLQDAIGRGQNPMSILPSSSTEPEFVTISDPNGGSSGSGAKYIYDRFPTNIRSEEQEEKRKQILAAASGAFEYIKNAPASPSVQVGGKDALSPMERAAERERMVLDIKVKLQGLWLRLLKLGATDDPLSSFEYGTILALIESDAEGIGGSGFVECISEHIHSGWQCQLTDEQFVAVKELLKTAISRATSRNDLSTIRDALEVSAEMYKKDSNNVPDFVQRHLISMSIWEELRFWEGYFDYLMERSSDKSANYAAQVTTQLILVSSHMAGLGIPDTDAWYMIEMISEKNSIGYKQLIQLRGFLTHIQQLRIGYWGASSMKTPSITSLGLTSPRPKDGTDENQQPAEASVVGRSWVQSMFSRDSSRVNSFARVRKWTSDGPSDSSSGAQKKLQTNVRVLRGHNGAVTALHCVTRREVWDLVGDREDAGFFISGSTDSLVKIWDPSIRGSELRATLKGHKRTVRAISSDRGKVVSGSDDQTVIVWDKQTSQLLEELKGHEAQVSCVRMLSGERVLTAAHDGTVKMWDVRTDTCVATVGRCSSAVLCMEYDDSTGILAAAGRDAVANVWDIRAGKQMHKLTGHTKWIRSARMVGDTLVTGSDDWTARVWSVSRGTCDAVLACHAGPILCVEYSAADRGIITGSTDGLLRFWENEEGGIKCTKNVTVHTASILSINAGENWLGVGAADNSMSLFNRPQDRLNAMPPGSASKLPSWQLYRTPQKNVAMVRCVASDLERKRICSGGRNGVLRLWEATINI
ncbi:DENN domain and WD repeat-containing protein SCD1 [Linum perenne]